MLYYRPQSCKLSFFLILAATYSTVISSTEAFTNQKGRSTRPSNIPQVMAKKEKWDPLRFVVQSSKFISLPKLPMPGIMNSSEQIFPGDVIWRSNDSNEAKFQFAPLDDVVMGGVSSSTFQKNGVWSGTVSDSNNGGFVGIRSTPFSKSLNMKNCQGIELTMRGFEDKVFKAVVRDSTDFNGVCWTATFGKKPEPGIFGSNRKDNNKERTVRISFDELIPTIFAKTVPGQTLNRGTIEAFQIAFSKFLFDGELNDAFTVGDFKLELLELKAY